MTQELKKRYSGRIDARATGEDALEMTALVWRLFQEWNPVGAERSALKELLGCPTAESATAMEYRFDGGFDGDVWRFALKDERVIKYDRIPME
jgi:hypothetical protein